MKILVIAALLTAVAAVSPPIERHPQRDLIVRSLQRRVDERASSRENHFYLLHRNHDEDWVYWPEGRLLWRTTFEPYYEKKGSTEVRARAMWDLRLYCPRKSIDLDHDIVASESELQPLDWRVTKDHAQRLIHECVTNSEVIIIYRKT